jgi:hypothetical protein
VVVVIQLNPIFVFGRSPAAQSAKTLETGKDFPYLGYIHAFALTSNNILEQSSIGLSAEISVSVKVFRKNVGCCSNICSFVGIAMHFTQICG